ncbi:MAG: hypothetical protein QF464_03650, partial [Myxococcota bacterium]|nr:hypothetical protein [Myxococcota bacterium]
MGRGGRVLHAADGRVVLQTTGGQLSTLDSPRDDLRPGDLVELSASGEMVRVHVHPTGEYPATGPDRRLHRPETWPR